MPCIVPGGGFPLKNKKKVQDNGCSLLTPCWVYPTRRNYNITHEEEMTSDSPLCDSESILERYVTCLESRAVCDIWLSMGQSNILKSPSHKFGKYEWNCRQYSNPTQEFFETDYNSTIFMPDTPISSPLSRLYGLVL